MGEFGRVLGTLEPWIHQYGVAAVFALLTFESLGLPLPGESVLVVAAVLAGRGEISLPSLLFSAWGGAVLGDNVGYLIGRTLGHNLLSRYGQKIGLNSERLGRVEKAFAHYGAVVVGFARFVNVLRQLNGIVAGTLQINWWRFLVFNALGAALWVLAWTMAGYYLGSHGGDAAAFVHDLGYLGAIFVFAALMVVLTYFYGHRFFASRRQK